MQSQVKTISKLRRPFVGAGAAVGALLSGWYLFRNLGPVSGIPDPIWTRFVNVALIMFSAIYLANLLRKAVEYLLRGKQSR